MTLIIQLAGDLSKPNSPDSGGTNPDPKVESQRVVSEKVNEVSGSEGFGNTHAETNLTSNGASTIAI